MEIKMIFQQNKKNVDIFILFKKALTKVKIQIVYISKFTIYLIDINMIL